MAIVYLIHYTTIRMDKRDRPSQVWHFLGVAGSAAELEGGSTPGATVYWPHRPRPAPSAGLSQIPHGHGFRPAQDARIADVWEVGTLAEAEALHGRLRRQGTRRKQCSICSPGNERGVGQGRWTRVETGEDRRVTHGRFRKETAIDG